MEREYHKVKYERDKAIYLLRDLTAMVRQLITDGNREMVPEAYRAADAWLSSPSNYSLDSYDPVLMTQRLGYLRNQLQRIKDRHLGDCPMSMDEISHARRHIADLRSIAHEALFLDIEREGIVRGTVEGALLAALDFINAEYSDAQAAALDGDPISREARPVRNKIVAALKELP